MQSFCTVLWTFMWQKEKNSKTYLFCKYVCSENHVEFLRNCVHVDGFISVAHNCWEWHEPQFRVHDLFADTHNTFLNKAMCAFLVLFFFSQLMDMTFEIVSYSFFVNCTSWTTKYEFCSDATNRIYSFAIFIGTKLHLFPCPRPFRWTITR